MTTQTELDADLLAVLEQHLTTRRELLKRVKAELWRDALRLGYGWDWSDVEKTMDRLIAEAKMPQGGVKGR